MPDADIAAPPALPAEVAGALKILAASPRHREAFLRSDLLRDTLAVPASRYVAARTRPGILARARVYRAAGYAVGLEQVGEGVTDRAEVMAIVDEYLALVDSIDPGLAQPTPPLLRLNFDLSNLGLAIDPPLARDAVRTIADAAAAKSIGVMLSMEGRSLVDGILDAFFALCGNRPALGLTVQAYLPRTPGDLDRLIPTGNPLRLVKGVYAEPAGTVLPRGPALDARFLDLAGRLAEPGGSWSCATHDAPLLDEVRRRGLLGGAAEVEMLHGVRPGLLRRLKDEGVASRIYMTYGENFFLHFLHRLAEAPENLFTALADYADPSRLEENPYA